jgi:MFS family permease
MGEHRPRSNPRLANRLPDYFYIDENTSTSEQLLLTLPTNLGLVLGSVALTVFGGKIRHWNWSMTVSMASLCLWGSLLALITPNNKALMITFATLCQFSYGWAAYLSVTYTQLGVPQHMLGLSGGLAGTARYAGGAVASACYSTAISNGMAKKLVELVPKAAIRTGVPADIMDSVIAAASSGATTTALKEIPGLTDTMVDALRMAFKESAAVGLR